MSTRQRPNVLITGSVGTGKSTLASQLAEKLDNFEYMNVGQIAEENGCFDGFDEARGCNILDEDKLLDQIEDRLNCLSGGCVVDYHGCDLFPQRWFDLVVVLRADTATLFDRLTARGYNEAKVEENVQCEIFNTIADEAAEAYDAEIVVEMQNDSVEMMDENLEKILQMVSQRMD